ncbi:MAG TPA: thymidine phosphorylase [Planctomycetota bacterium]|nr:thymidine phosphorylase [Planctomycetota bacterium]
MRNARDVLLKKRDGGELSDAEIEDFVAGAASGEIPDYQTSVLLASIFRHGFTTRELAAWTRAMLESGSILSFDGVAAQKVDKHSTGGVGDKVSIPLAPAVAACGVAVPMISGRGLGHTGGTLDKLEAIPGFRTQLAPAEFARVLESCGVALGGQTPEIVPADKKFYALRDATGLVESVPLIASSILSKKLAEGLDALVLDVKFGSGAFLPEIERGRELARTMLELAGAMHLRASIFLTSMARPLGKSAGHTLEIAESIDCLRGKGPADLRELVVALGAEMLRLANAARDEGDGRTRIEKALDSGSALDVFRRVVVAQGGDVSVIDDPARLKKAAALHVVEAARSGWIAYTDVRAVGNAIIELGGGRQRVEDTIDPTVGIEFESTGARAVAAGEPIFRVHHAHRGLDSALASLARSFTIVDERPAAEALVRERMLG